MTTPGFTAEASLGTATGHHRQDRVASSAVPVRVGMAATTMAVPSQVQPVPNIPPHPLQGLPLYGKWCGPNYGSGVPQDKVDQVCCRHDHCYSDRGELDCSCDRDLLTHMPGAIADSSTPAEGRAAGALIMQIFASDPFCLCHRILVPWPGIPPWKLVHAPVPVPGGGPLKLCPPPYA
jgi:hypothetical protein